MKKRAYTKETIETYMDDSIEQNWVRSTVGEFNYLLRAISEREFEFFSTATIPHIYKNADRLIANVDKEFLKDAMVFEKISSRETVEGNLNDLKDILISIKEYYDDAGFDSNTDFNELVAYSAIMNMPTKQREASRLILASAIVVSAISAYIFFLI